MALTARYPISTVFVGDAGATDLEALFNLPSWITTGSAPTFTIDQTKTELIAMVPDTVAHVSITSASVVLDGDLTIKLNISALPSGANGLVARVVVQAVLDPAIGEEYALEFESAKAIEKDDITSANQLGPITAVLTGASGISLSEGDVPAVMKPYPDDAPAEDPTVPPVDVIGMTDLETDIDIDPGVEPNPALEWGTVIVTLRLALGARK